jgi:four helix bundle protein
MEKKENIIVDKSFSFAISIIELYKELKESKDFILANQLVGAGTSIGANVNEATAAQSKADFIAKMSIASKEARETNYWLRLLSASGLITSDISNELKQSEDLISILTAIVKTSQTNR